MPPLVIACLSKTDVMIFIAIAFAPGLLAGVITLMSFLARARMKDQLAPLLLPEIIVVPVILSVSAAVASGMDGAAGWIILFGVTLLGAALGWALVRWRGWTLPGRAWPSLIAMPMASVLFWGFLFLSVKVLWG